MTVVLRAILTCPRPGCGAEFEAYWDADADSVEEVPEAPERFQVCPQCGSSWMAEYPGWSFRMEAG